MKRFNGWAIAVACSVAFASASARAQGSKPDVFMDVVVNPHVVPQGGALRVTIALLNLERDPLDAQLWGAIVHDHDVVAKLGPEPVHLPPQELVTIEKVLPIAPDAERGHYALIAEVGARPGDGWARAHDRFAVVGKVELRAEVAVDRVPADRPVPIDAVVQNNTDHDLEVQLFGKLDHDHRTVVKIAPVSVKLAAFERKSVHLEIPLPDHPPLGDYVMVLFAGGDPGERPWARSSDRFQVVRPRR